MASSPFDFVKELTTNKKPWSKLTETEKKDFGEFMTNRIVSMNLDYVELANDIQRLYLPKEIAYRLYSEILPRRMPYSKYIAKSKSSNYSEELIRFIIKEYEISSEDASDYLDILKSTPSGLEALRALLQKYGCDDKTIKTLLK